MTTGAVPASAPVPIDVPECHAANLGLRPGLPDKRRSSVVHRRRLRSVQMNRNLYNPPMRPNSFDRLRAATAIVALTAAMFLHVAAAENSQDEYARIADWRAKRL